MLGLDKITAAKYHGSDTKQYQENESAIAH